MGSASLISALALSRDDTVTVSLLREHHRAEEIRKARRLLNWHVLGYVSNTKKRIAAVRNMDLPKKYLDACRRAVLLPNYSKHSPIGASIKEVSFPCVFLYLSRVYTLLLNYLPVYLFLSIKTFNSTLKIPACLT